MKSLKKSFYTAAFVLIFLSFNSTFAQSVMFGLKAGVNANNISSPGVEGDFKTNIKPGFHIGPFVQVRMSKLFSFRHEMLFMMKGFNSTVQVDSTTNNKYKVSYYYLDLPWMINLHVSERFLINAGVVPSLFLGGNVPNDFKKTIFDKTNVAPIDFAPMIGMEANLSDYFAAGMRFTYSTVSVIDVDGHKPKLYTIQLYGLFGKFAGVRFGKKRKR
jgi:hypothetical protein